MKAFIIAFAAVVTAAYAPQTGPFRRLLPPEPTIPIEDPVTDAELERQCPTTSTPATPSEDTAEPTSRDRTKRKILARFRSRNSELKNRRQSPHRRFSFLLRLRKGELSIAARRNPDRN
jgi:hypothetical protein